MNKAIYIISLLALLSLSLLLFNTNDKNQLPTDEVEDSTNTLFVSNNLKF